MTLSTRGRPTRFLTDFEDQAEDATLEIPEDLSALSDEQLGELTTQARAAFDSLYQGGNATLGADDLATLSALTEGIVALDEQAAARAADADARAAEAAELAARVNPAAGEAEASAEDETEEESSEEEAPTEGEANEAEANAETESLAAGGARQTRINLAGLRSRQGRRPAQEESSTELTIRDLAMAAPDVPGFAQGQGMDFLDMGRAVNARLQAFNPKAYLSRAKAGKATRHQYGVASIRKPFADDLIIHSNDASHVEEVLARAADETRLPQGSLVASGGWCAPSETVYDLFELESRDGLFSVPEVGISRGGISWTQGPDFSAIFGHAGFFSYTEEQDITGEDYPKPCFHIPCPEFDEERLQLDGLCLTAGLLQQRGYPEVIARTVRGSLIAHAHKMAANKINAIVADSTQVTLGSDQVGAVAPILTAIELQVEHYKDVHRMPRNASLEAVFPFWVRGAIRSDLSRRLGVELLSVPDSRIDGWFRERGINPQFVYNWQSVGSTAASGFTAWPTEVDFLLYAAGTWVAGGADVITIDTLYDSTLLGTNDFTALFTEEGWLMTKRGHDSRVVTVPICPTGDTGGGVAIDCDGTAGA